MPCAEMLEVVSAPNNGTIGRLSHTLVKSSVLDSLSGPALAPLASCSAAGSKADQDQKRSDSDCSCPRWNVSSSVSLCELNFKQH